MRQLLRFLVGVFFLLAGLLAGPAVRAQAPAWQTIAAAAGDVQVRATATDGKGNVYLTGGFTGAATFGTTTLSTTNAQEIFVAKWNAATNSFAWAVQGTSATMGQNTATAIVANGATVFVAGSFVSPTLTLGSASPLINAQAGTSDLFVAQLTDTGTSAGFAWVRRAGGTANDYAQALAYSAPFLYAGGISGGAATFGSYSLARAGGFVVSYSSTGTVFYQPVTVGGAVTALTAANGSVYAAGSFTSATPVFVDATHTLTSAGAEDIFVARLSNSLLSYIWAQRAGGAGSDVANALTANGNNIYVAGSFSSASANFGSTTLSNAGGGALFVSKLTDGGTTATFSWALQNGSTSSYNSAYGLAAYGTSIYLTGVFGGAATFGSTTLTSAGTSDILLAKLIDGGSNAAFIWAQQAGGSGLDYAYSLLRLGTQLYVAGRVATPASFGSLSIGTAIGPRAGFLASLTDPAPVLTLSAPNVATVGGTITLYGSGFSGATAITFAGSTNNVVTTGFTVSASGTEIQGVVVPAGAQSGVLSVTTPLGTSNGLVSFTVLATPNPAPAWRLAASEAGGTIQYSTTDASGNILVAGTFGSSITLGGTTLVGAGGNDLFVAKWSPASSSYVWAQRAGGAGTETVYGLAMSGSSVYVAGYYGGASASFGTTTLTNASASLGTLDGFVAKLTDAGTSASFTWVQAITGDGDEYVEALAVSGNTVYVGGDFDGLAMSIGGSTLTTNVSEDDGFVAKLTDNGSTVTSRWLLGVGGPNYSSVNVYGLAVQGNAVYLTASFYGTVGFGSTSLTSTNASAPDVVVARLTDVGSTASFTAAVQAGGNGAEYPFGLVANGTSLYVFGYSTSTSSTWGSATLSSAGSTDGFVAKLTDGGTTGLSFNWAQLLGGPGYEAVLGLAVRGSSLYVAGYFSGAFSLGSSTLASAGLQDGFAAKLTDAGASSTPVWAQAAGGLSGDNMYTVALSGNSLYVGGYVTPAANFGSVAIIGSQSGPVATLATLNDPTLLATIASANSPQQLYPNPAQTVVNVRLPTGASAVLLLDNLGRELRRQAVSASATEATLDVHGLAAGLYLVRVMGTGPATTHRLQVE